MINNSMDIYPILSRTFALEFDGTIASSQLALPSFLRGNDSDALLFTVGQNTPGLPPLIIRCICDVKDITVTEEQAPTWQPIVLGRVVIKEGPVIHSIINQMNDCHGETQRPTIKTTRTCRDKRVDGGYGVQGWKIK